MQGWTYGLGSVFTLAHMRINLTKVTESLSSSNKLHAALFDAVPKSPGRITAQRDLGSPTGEVIPSQCHFSIRRGEASANFSHRHQPVLFCTRFGSSFGMDEAMSGLDSFHFVMSDKCKRIKTRNWAMKSQSHRAQFPVATMTFAFTLSGQIKVLKAGKTLPKQISSMTYVTFCACVNDGTKWEPG